MALLGLGAGISTEMASATPVTHAISTTTNTGASTGNGACLNGGGSGDPTNCNLYQDKQDVWFSGLPTSLADGTYFFAVLSPGGQPDPNDGSAKNLSTSDTHGDRTFSITGGTISYSGSHGFENNKLQLFPYDDTTNPGGVYTLAVCSLANGYPVKASDCKYDAFKVLGGNPPPNPPAAEPTVTKDAAGAYDTTWTWGITKAADKTLVKQVGGSATFTYTVSVTHDSGTNSNVTVTGTIDVTNPNFDDAFNTVPLTLSDVSDQLSDGTVCTVDTSGGLTLTAFDNLFPYTCHLSGLPAGQLDNTATASWGAQSLSNGTDLTAGSASFTFAGISFTQSLIDDQVSVTDSFAGTLGTVSAADPSPTTFTYARTVPVPSTNCQSYDNTATFTTDTTGTTGSASQTVTVCGPARTGALTMGFWQNKNGQNIIKTASEPALINWLKGYAPFANITATNATGMAAYVTNVIKAANASGATMNAMLKAQMLSTALDVYFSNPALGGNRIGAPAPIGGVSIDLTKVCKNPGSCTAFIDARPAFGGSASLTVSQILAYAASQSNTGGTVWYGQVKSTQELAKDVFDAINNQVAFGP
ncbi:MAG TPA: hypothetical protein VJ872_18020 [Nocardioides sp.]|nr:hypothetical protein [Nocardioides sp.]